MIFYDPKAPLIYIHVPKAAGTSAKQWFKRWFADGFYEHYYDEVNAILPIKRDVAALHEAEKQIVIYGHFNAKRGFGIQQYYPEVNQFVTILRDPFEAAVSEYFFLNFSY